MVYGLSPESMKADVIRERCLVYLRLRWASLVALGIISLFGGVSRDSISLQNLVVVILLISVGLNTMLYGFVKLTKTKNIDVKLFSALALLAIIYDIILISLIAYISTKTPPSRYILVYIMPILISSALFSRAYLFMTTFLTSIGYIASNYPNVTILYANTSAHGDPLIVTALYVFLLLIITILIDFLFTEKHRKDVETAQLEMISLVSHQLRTPASAVKGFLSFVMDGYGGKLTKKQRTYIEKAYEENDIQIKLVDNILNVAKLDLKNISVNLERSDLSKIVQDVLDEHSVAFVSRDQEIDYMCYVKDPILSLDPQLMRMVIDNLLSNASKYCGKGGVIKVSITGKKNTMYLSIEDNGVGIAPKEQNKLFQRFYRVVAKIEGEYVEGSGLGLYLAKRLVEMHKGTLTLVSYPGEGTLLTVALKRR